MKPDRDGWLLAGLGLAALSSVLPLHAAADAPRPNVILIVADDLGYGDLGAYGATDLATPNIDRLAREGIRFTDFYAVANTCSPSRAALMTGRYPPRSGVNAVLFHDTPEGLPDREITIAELLRDAGYRTGMIGKWHLGATDEFMPLRHGFSEFFGVPHSNDEKNFFVYDGPDRLPETVDQSQLIRHYTDRALAFLESAAHDEQPFFLYIAHNAPHVPLYPSADFAGRSQRGTFGDVVEELDASVGEVIAKVRELGLERETLTIFTSDNGPWLAMRDWGGRAGDLRGGKTSTFEGGHRVPALAHWPGRIPGGTETRDVANMMDWLPTLAELAGADLPDDRTIDGRSLVPVLEGSSAREATPLFYFRLRLPVGDQRAQVGAVRDGRWKLKLPQRGYL
jgi:arylsulfatase A-like enzyme